LDTLTASTPIKVETLDLAIPTGTAAASGGAAAASSDAPAGPEQPRSFYGRIQERSKSMERVEAMIRKEREERQQQMSAFEEWRKQQEARGFSQELSKQEVAQTLEAHTRQLTALTKGQSDLADELATTKRLATWGAAAAIRAEAALTSCIIVCKGWVRTDTAKFRTMALLDLTRRKGIEDHQVKFDHFKPNGKVSDFTVITTDSPSVANFFLESSRPQREYEGMSQEKRNRSASGMRRPRTSFGQDHTKLAGGKSDSNASAPASKTRKSC
jgi:hypothetical protein